MCEENTFNINNSCWEERKLKCFIICLFFLCVFIYQMFFHFKNVYFIAGWKKL